MIQFLRGIYWEGETMEFIEEERFTEEELIEEMISLMQKKYGRVFINKEISYPGCTWDRPVLCLYPEDGDSKKDVFAVQRLLRNGEFFLQDTYHGVYYKEALIQVAKEEIDKYLDSYSLCVHANCEFKDDIDYTKDVFAAASKGALVPDMRIYLKRGMYDKSTMKSIFDELVQVFSDKYYGGVLSVYTLSKSIFKKVNNFKFEERLPSRYNKEYREEGDFSLSKMWIDKKILIEE